MSQEFRGYEQYLSTIISIERSIQRGTLTRIKDVYESPEYFKMQRDKGLPSRFKKRNYNIPNVIEGI